MSEEASTGAGLASVVLLLLLCVADGVEVALAPFLKGGAAVEIGKEAAEATAAAAAAMAEAVC